MDQLSFSDIDYQQKKRKTRKDLFLQKMDQLIPWQRLINLIEPCYPKAGRGRQPYDLKVMLRIHCLQLFYNLSDPAMEDSLYDVESMRRFAGLSLTGPIPDETTILKFRHLLERYNFCQAILSEVNSHLESHGLILKEGTIVDATIISAPTSTKNQMKARDPEMHQTKKGNQWYFGMKMHIGVDDTHGVIHSVETTAANTHDITQTHRLLHGNEKTGWGDAGYQGVDKRDEMAEVDIDWQIAARIGKRESMNERELKMEESKASIRAKVEHPFHRIKQQFGYSKVRYKGLAKNTCRLNVLAAFTNLLRCQKMLLA